MNVADIRIKSVDELKDELLKLRKEQLNLRFQRSTGQLENTAAMRNARKSVARVKTVLTEKLNGIEVASHKKATAKKDAPKKDTKKTASKKPAAAKAEPKKKKTA